MCGICSRSRPSDDLASQPARARNPVAPDSGRARRATVRHGEQRPLPIAALAIAVLPPAALAVTRARRARCPLSAMRRVARTGGPPAARAERTTRSARAAGRRAAPAACDAPRPHVQPRCPRSSRPERPGAAEPRPRRRVGAVHSFRAAGCPCAASWPPSALAGCGGRARRRERRRPSRGRRAPRSRGRSPTSAPRRVARAARPPAPRRCARCRRAPAAPASRLVARSRAATPSSTPTRSPATPRCVGRLDGALTGPQPGDAGRRSRWATSAPTRAALGLDAGRPRHAAPRAPRPRSAASPTCAGARRPAASRLLDNDLRVQRRRRRPRDRVARRAAPPVGLDRPR